MFNDTTKIVWLIYQSGFGGDQLYYLLNQFGKFAYYQKTNSTLTSNGKRLVKDLFDYKFHNNTVYPNLKQMTGPVDLLNAMNQNLLDSSHVINCDCPVIIKMHYSCDENQLNLIAPGSSIMYMTSGTGNYKHYFDLAKKKNAEFHWFYNEWDQVRFNSFINKCQKFPKTFSNGYMVDADVFFTNNREFWQQIQKFLKIEIDIDRLYEEHQIYLSLHKI